MAGRITISIVTPPDGGQRDRGGAFGELEPPTDGGSNNPSVVLKDSRGRRYEPPAVFQHAVIGQNNRAACAPGDRRRRRLGGEFRGLATRRPRPE